jgi:prophage regulatory protein
MRILRIGEVEERTGVTRSTINRWEAEGLFPARRRLGAGAVGWLEEDVDAWIEGRPTAGSIRVQDSR